MTDSFLIQFTKVSAARLLSWICVKSVYASYNLQHTINDSQMRQKVGKFYFLLF